MLVHGIGRILTFNVNDFQRYPGISALEPRQVLAAGRPHPDPLREGRWLRSILLGLDPSAARTTC